MTYYEHVTTQAAVDIYSSANPIFQSLLREVKTLSAKKPDATLSANKVKVVNRVLTDVLTILKDEPTGKYLELLDDDALPQVSDALLMMVQFDTALNAFRNKYLATSRYGTQARWVTEEWVAENAEGEDDEDENT